MNKYYGCTPKGTFWKELKIVLVVTCSYEIHDTVPLLEKALENVCAHSGLEFLGTYAVRDINRLSNFQKTEVIQGAKNSAKKLLREIS